MKKAILDFLNVTIDFLTHILKLGIKDGLKVYFKTRYSSASTIEIALKDIKYPVFLRNKTSDIPTFYQIFFHKDYEIDTQGMKPKTIIDCGANVGYASVYFKNKYPEANIYAIEPEQSNFKQLQLNTKPYSGIICINAGIWSSEAWLNVESIYDNSHWAFSVVETQSPSSDSIKAVSIDAIVKEHNIKEIDILKVDIEGSEVELFSENYHSWLSITNILIIELNDRYRKGTSKAFFNAIAQFDFSIYFMGENLICVKNK